MTQKQTQAQHTPGPLNRLNTWWQTGNKDDPTYAAGNARFADDVGFMMKSHAELLAALKRTVEAYREGVQDDREPMVVRQAISAIAKVEGR